jgi:hypothetical protein
MVHPPVDSRGIMRGSARLILRVALVVAYLAQVAPNAHAPSAVAPGQPPASRLSSSKLARSLSEAGRNLQLRLVERTRGGEVEVTAEEGAEAAQQDGGETRVGSHAAVDRTRRGFYPRVYEAIPEAEGNGYGSMRKVNSLAVPPLAALAVPGTPHRFGSWLPHAFKRRASVAQVTQWQLTGAAAVSSRTVPQRPIPKPVPAGTGTLPAGVALLASNQHCTCWLRPCRYGREECSAFCVQQVQGTGD